LRTTPSAVPTPRSSGACVQDSTLEPFSIERAVRLSSPRHRKERAPCIGRRSPSQTGVCRDPMHTPARSAQLLHKVGFAPNSGVSGDSAPVTHPRLRFRRRLGQQRDTRCGSLWLWQAARHKRIGRAGVNVGEWASDVGCNRSRPCFFKTKTPAR
jgi:hypothetical protein